MFIYMTTGDMFIGKFKKEEDCFFIVNDVIRIYMDEDKILSINVFPVLKRVVKEMYINKKEISYYSFDIKEEHVNIYQGIING